MVLGVLILDNTRMGAASNVMAGAKEQCVVLSRLQGEPPCLKSMKGEVDDIGRHDRIITYTPTSTARISADYCIKLHAHDVW